MKRTLCFLAAAFLLGTGASSQAGTVDAEFVANVLSNLDLYVSWPADKKFEGTGDMIVISVVGNSALATELRNLNGQESGSGLKIKVRVVAPDMLPSNSHMVVLTTADQDVLRSTLQQLHSTGCMVVGAEPGFGALGCMLNFFDDGTKTRVEVNVDAVKAVGFKIKSSFLKVAQTVD